jgi:hypothetical protein
VPGRLVRRQREISLRLPAVLCGETGSNWYHYTDSVTSTAAESGMISPGSAGK